MESEKVKELEEKEYQKYRTKRGISFKTKAIIACVMAIIFMLIGAGIYHKVQSLIDDKKVTTDYISGKLEDVGELTTQKLTYTGYASIEEGKIPFITKKGFSMKYNAVIRAGMEVEKFDIKVKEKNVIVKIPHAEVLDVKVDSDSIEFYDEKFSLFNRTKKEDVTKAIGIAEDDVLKKADYSQLIENADEYAEELIIKILKGSVGDRERVVSFE